MKSSSTTTLRISAASSTTCAARSALRPASTQQATCHRKRWRKSCWRAGPRVSYTPACVTAEVHVSPASTLRGWRMSEEGHACDSVGAANRRRKSFKWQRAGGPRKENSEQPLFSRQDVGLEPPPRNRMLRLSCCRPAPWVILPVPAESANQVDAGEQLQGIEIERLQLGLQEGGL